MKPVKSPRRYGWLQIAVKNLSPYIQDVQAGIDPAHLIDLEDDHHITILYGLGNLHYKAVEEACRDLGTVYWETGEVTLFQNKTSDVLKIDVKGPDVPCLNDILKHRLPHVCTIPDYKPHVTIAHLKPGYGKYYERLLMHTRSIAHALTYHTRERTEHTIALGGGLSLFRELSNINPREKNENIRQQILREEGLS